MPEKFAKAIMAGDVCVDVHIAIKDVLRNDDVAVMPHRVSAGGTIGGTSVALARLGIPVSFLGTIGKDYGGRYIRSEFEKEGVDTSMLIVKEELNTINVFAFIDDEGERHLWGFPRVDQAYTDLDLKLIDIEKIKSASWFHSSGMTVLFSGSIRQSLVELFKIAYEAGVPTSFDLNTRVSDLNLLDQDGVEAIRQILPYVKYLTGSGKDEFYSFHPCADWKDSVRYFVNDERTVIARMGKEGFLLIDKDGERSCPSYEVEVVNTTGAGDSFNAGFICGMLEGLNTFEACKLANAVSAYKISRIGNYDRKAIGEFMNNTAFRVG